MRHLISGLLTVLVSGLLASPVLALPGQNEADMLSWHQKHTLFSSPLLKEEYFPGMPWLMAFGAVPEASWFLQIDALLSAPRTGAAPVVKFEQWALVRLPDGQSGPQSPEERFKTQPLTCKPVWTRGHPMADELLTRAHSAALAKDFRESKLIYSGPFLIAADVGWGHEGPLWNPEPITPALMKQVQQRSGKPFGKRGRMDVAIYQGKLYNYEVRDSEQLMSTPTGCQILKINSLQTGAQIAAVLSHNLKVYQQWQRRYPQQQGYDHSR